MRTFTDVDGDFCCPSWYYQTTSITIDLPWNAIDGPMQDSRSARGGFSSFTAEKSSCYQKNTNPDHPGTRIVLKYLDDEFPVSGVAGDSGFVSVSNMSKYLMNPRSWGLVVSASNSRRPEYWLGTYKAGTSMTCLSFYVHENCSNIQKKEILRRISSKAEVDHAEIEQRALSIIMIVGEKWKRISGWLLQPRCLSENNINIQVLSQGFERSFLSCSLFKDQKRSCHQGSLPSIFSGKERLSMAVLSKGHLSTSNWNFLSFHFKKGRKNSYLLESSL